MVESSREFQPPWYLEPLPGESISHYFGRYCRHESVSSPAQLSKAAGIGPVLGRWEKFRFIPYPSPKELAAVGGLIGLTVSQLEALLPQVVTAEGEINQITADSLVSAMLQRNSLSSYGMAVSITVKLCQAWG